MEPVASNTFHSISVVIMARPSLLLFSMLSGNFLLSLYHIKSSSDKPSPLLTKGFL